MRRHRRSARRRGRRGRARDRRRAAWARRRNGSPGDVEVPRLAARRACRHAAASAARGARARARCTAISPWRSPRGARGRRPAHGDGGGTATAPASRPARALRGRRQRARRRDGRAAPGCYASAARECAAVREARLDRAQRRRRAPRRVRFALAGALARLGAAAAARRRARVPHAAQRRLPRAALERTAYRSTSVWRSEAPDRLSYRTTSGNAGVIDRPPALGSRRRRRLEGARSRTRRSSCRRRPWGAGAYDVRCSAAAASADARSCASRCSSRRPRPGTRSRSTAPRCGPLTVEMTATAHFMRDRYVAFNAPRQIRPPPGAEPWLTSRRAFSATAAASR